MMKKTGERGPIYGVELIDGLPLGTGGFTQAMPSLQDLELAREIGGRLPAGYEVLLRHFQEVVEEIETLRQSFFAEMDKMKAEAIQARFYFQRKSTGTGDCCAWNRLKEMLGCGMSDAEDREWLEAYQARINCQETTEPTHYSHDLLRPGMQGQI